MTVAEGERAIELTYTAGVPLSTFSEVVEEGGKNARGRLRAGTTAAAGARAVAQSTIWDDKRGSVFEE